MKRELYRYRDEERDVIIIVKLVTWKRKVRNTASARVKVAVDK
jgi:hypothetical protein